jgi:hypothetical protein
MQEVSQCFPFTSDYFTSYGGSIATTRARDVLVVRPQPAPRQRMREPRRHTCNLRHARRHPTRHPALVRA